MNMDEVEIIVKSKDESKAGLESSKRHVKELGNEVERSGGKFSVFGRIGTGAAGKLKAGLGLLGTGMAGVAVGAGALAITAAPKLLDMGIKVEALGNKAKVVFGGSLPIIQKWADVAAIKMGVTSKEAQGLAAGIGDLLTPMGFTQRQAATMSTQVENLAGAFSQWSNGTLNASDANNILSDALTGQYDSLKSLGVQIDVNTIKEILHKQGKDKLTGAALKQATAEIALAEITRQSSNAIAGYTGGTNKLALAKNKLSNQIGTVREKIISALIPAMTKATTWAGSMLPRALATLNVWWERNKTNIQSFGLRVLTVGAGIIGVFLKIVAANLFMAGMLLRGWSMILGAFLSFVSTILNLGIRAFSWVPGVGDKLRTAKVAVDSFRNTVTSSMSSASKAALNMASAANRAGDAMLSAAGKAWNLANNIRNIPPNKTVNVVYKQTNAAGNIIGRAIAHGGILGAAGGGPRSRSVLVGESGPELAELPPGTMIKSNPDTNRMMGTSSAPIVQIIFPKLTGSKFVDELFEDLRKGIRVNGGNVQAVLGK